MGSVVGAADTAQLSQATVVVVTQQDCRAALRAQRRSLAHAKAPLTRFVAFDTTPSLQHAQQSPQPQSAATTAVEVVTVVTVVAVTDVVEHSESQQLVPTAALAL